MRSSDGSSWTPSGILPSPSSGHFWTNVTYGGGVYLAVVQSSTLAVTSPNGFAWKTRTLPSAEDWECLTYGAGSFVILSNSNDIGTVSY